MSSSLPSHEFVRVILLSVPLIVGGILHMIAVKADILSYLKKPIHQRWFGLNKTWRGFFIMPLATWPGVILAQKLETLFDLNAPLLTTEPAWLLGLLLGLGYCLAELPNSFIKRRLGVKEGQTSDRFKWFFVVLDQADSAFGCMLAYRILLPISWTTIVLTIVFGTVIHLVINVSLYKAGIRKNPF
ncbi:CDP-archaeol synthase [Peredibacter starrii]|uniref:CDP-archaeol synthase n=1 Tax=Peredibacter starrii TaxID=28202 RepID=A0AAX4HPT3_9BACT|nr:CDP-archaeol synthase [Peredibacter starrii]WPU64989.1 CDP-archaeol synthase [Peredibacter starrii]